MKRRELLEGAKLRLYEIREIWYKSFADSPCRGLEERDVASLDSKGVYTSLRSAQTKQEELMQERENRMRGKDRYDFLRMAAKKGVEISGTGGEPGMEFIIYSYTAMVRDIKEKVDGCYWAKPKRIKGRLVLREPNVFWKFPNPSLEKTGTDLGLVIKIND
ncbi:MAG: hypothetical protein AABX54_03420 [Nanoarchaeota archaeon]